MEICAVRTNQNVLPRTPHRLTEIYRTGGTGRHR